jgi:hypothetical protein
MFDLIVLSILFALIVLSFRPVRGAGAAQVDGVADPAL